MCIFASSDVPKSKKARPNTCATSGADDSRRSAGGGVYIPHRGRAVVRRSCSGTAVAPRTRCCMLSKLVLKDAGSTHVSNTKKSNACRS